MLGTEPATRLSRSKNSLFVFVWLAFTCAVQGTHDRALGQLRHRRQADHGAWSHWADWSACSSTCGKGASFRTRRCIRFPGEQTCQGKPRQYRVCELGECPTGSIPFRAIQCSLYNGKPIMGSSQSQYQWVPFYGAPNLCDLNCLAVGHTFYYTFGRVLDGTLCSPAAQDLCISGQCLTAGCDSILGSDAQLDACGICNGRNESCVFVRKVFQTAFVPSSGFFGYRNVTQIPAGARHIKVTDHSRNYLALMTANQRYVINGDWIIDWPGVYEVAGTQVRYARTADVHESFEAAGPTHEDLSVMILFQEHHPGIEYQFWLPREQGQRGQDDISPLHHPHTRGIADGASRERKRHFLPTVAALPLPKDWARAKAPRPAQPTSAPARMTTLPGTCGKCDTPKGKSQRIHHYCQSDFVFRARILAKHRRGLETRYDVQVKHTYRNRFPLVHREYVWVSNTCDCPLLTERHEYVLMARRHVNQEHTLNRILLPRGSYARPWSPREDLQLREVAQHCLQTGSL